MAGVSQGTKSFMENTELIKVSEEKHKYCNTEYKKVSAKMYDYACDVKLKVDKNTFRAHREVLANASDYFDAMFSHNMKEKDQDVIEFHEISAQGFTLMLEYFYHGHVTIDAENIEDLLEAARFFHIEWLIQICCDFLIRHMCIANYHQVLNLADKYFLGDVSHDIFRFIGQNFMMLAEKSIFMDLSYDLFLQLLVDDYYIDASEYFIFQTALKWLSYDQDRQKYFLPLLQVIRYPLLEIEQLDRMPESILQVPELQEMVMEARDYQINLSKQPLLTSDLTEVRGGKDVVMLISALEDAHLFQYKIPGVPDFFSEEVDSSFLDCVFEFTCVTQIGNFVFIAGGYDRRSWCSSSAFYRYNPRNREWVRLASMKQPRVSHSLCAAPSGLYAVAGIEHVVEAGHDHENILHTVEYYAPETGQWSYIPSLTSGIFSHATTVHGETLYVSGGITDNTEDNIPVNKLQAFSPGGDTWELKAAMISERQGHAMATHDDKLFVFGGYTTGQDTMSFDHNLTSEVYDIQTNQWSLLENTPADFGHIYSSIVKFESNFYMVGGKDADRFLVCRDIEKAEDEGEYCGQYVQKVVTVRVALPYDIECVHTPLCAEVKSSHED